MNINWYMELLEEIDEFDKKELSKDEIKNIIDKVKDKEESINRQKIMHDLEMKVEKLWREHEECKEKCKEEKKCKGPCYPHKKGFLW